MDREAADGSHHLRPVDERDTFLRTQLHGLQTHLLERVGAGHARALDERFSFAHHDQSGMRERGEIARCADAAVHRDDRMHASVEHLEQHLRETGTDARAARRERVGAKQQHRADDVYRQRIANAGGVAPDEVALECLELGHRDADRREIAEAGVHAVDRRVAGGELRDELRGI